MRRWRKFRERGDGRSKEGRGGVGGRRGASDWRNLEERRGQGWRENRGQNIGDASEEADEVGFGGGFQAGGNWRGKKLDLLFFTSHNLDGWILRAKTFFTFYHLSSEEQVEVALVWRCPLGISRKIVGVAF